MLKGEMGEEGKRGRGWANGQREGVWDGRRVLAGAMGMEGSEEVSGREQREWGIVARRKKISFREDITEQVNGSSSLSYTVQLVDGMIGYFQSPPRVEHRSLNHDAISISIT